MSVVCLAGWRLQWIGSMACGGPMNITSVAAVSISSHRSCVEILLRRFMLFHLDAIIILYFSTRTCLSQCSAQVFKRAGCHLKRAL